MGHIYPLPITKTFNHENNTKTSCGLQKFIKVSIAFLLLNEIVIGLFMSWKRTDLNAEQQHQIAGMMPNIEGRTKSDTIINSTHTNLTSPILPADKNDKDSNNNKAMVSPDELDHIDILKNACISYTDDSQLHHIWYRGVYGSWDKRTKDRNDRESFHLASRKNRWLKTYMVSDYLQPDMIPPITSTSNFTTPLMFVPAMFDHSLCIHDLLFSLLPMAYRGKLNTYQAVAVSRPNATDDLVRDYAGNYCTLVLKELGWFQSITTVPNKKCLDSIAIPAFMYHRAPRGWAKGIHSANDFMYDNDLPLPMLHYFQQQMWKAFLTNNKYYYKEKKNRILFDTREGLRRDEWTNAKEIAKLIQDELDPDLFEVIIVDDVGAMTIKEQAALFQSASILVGPVASSISNAIFMKPRSVVFEITCGKESSWIRDWITDLGIRHSVVRADDIPCINPYRKTYAVQPSSIVDLIVDICWQGRRKKVS